MNGPLAERLPGGRLRLWHGPIDLVVGADAAAREAAFAAAWSRFQTILPELVEELPLLRRPVGEWPDGPTARRMVSACLPHGGVFVTPMAAVAGAVAEEILDAMAAAAPLTRAYVNNGGDIALTLADGERFTAAMASPEGAALGRVRLAGPDAPRGVATSGWRGRSFSLGVADSVTVLACGAAMADVAATLIANAVDLPGHPAIHRVPACEIAPDNDLGPRLVTRAVGALSSEETDRALRSGAVVAEAMLGAGLVRAAALHLRGQVVTTDPHALCRIEDHAHA